MHKFRTDIINHLLSKMATRFIKIFQILFIINFLSSICRINAQLDYQLAGEIKHNEFRAMHGNPNLKLDDKISKDAQDCANYMAETVQYGHVCKREQQGENLFAMFGKFDGDIPKIVAMAVQLWYDEIKDYNFDKPGFSSKTGHFTSAIWKSSTKLGIGFAFNAEKSMMVVVARYNPPGNVNTRERFIENVPIPL